VDFNSNNKWLERAVMFNAEQALLIALEQYDSQKKKLAITQCLNNSCSMIFSDFNI